MRRAANEGPDLQVESKPITVIGLKERISRFAVSEKVIPLLPRGIVFIKVGKAL